MSRKVHIVALCKTKTSYDTIQYTVDLTPVLHSPSPSLKLKVCKYYTYSIDSKGRALSLRCSEVEVYICIK